MVLLVEGTGDRIVDLEYGRRYAESIPGCCFEVISEAGHFPHIEKLMRCLDRSVHSRALTVSWHGQPLSIWVQTWVQSAQILGKKVYYDATPDKKNQYVRISASVSGPGGRRFESSRPTILPDDSFRKLCRRIRLRVAENYPS
jgi:hypothetical protein